MPPKSKKASLSQTQHQPEHTRNVTPSNSPKIARRMTRSQVAAKGLGKKSPVKSPAKSPIILKQHQDTNVKSRSMIKQKRAVVEEDGEEEGEVEERVVTVKKSSPRLPAKQYLHIDDDNSDEDQEEESDLDNQIDSEISSDSDSEGEGVHDYPEEEEDGEDSGEGIEMEQNDGHAFSDSDSDGDTDNDPLNQEEPNEESEEQEEQVQEQKPKTSNSAASKLAALLARGQALQGTVKQKPMVEDDSDDSDDDRVEEISITAVQQEHRDKMRQAQEAQRALEAVKQRKRQEKNAKIRAAQEQSNLAKAQRELKKQQKKSFDLDNSNAMLPEELLEEAIAEQHRLEFEEAIARRKRGAFSRIELEAQGKKVRKLNKPEQQTEFEKDGYTIKVQNQKTDRQSKFAQLIAGKSEKSRQRAVDQRRAMMRTGTQRMNVCSNPAVLKNTRSEKNVTMGLRLQALKKERQH